jgi:hypothetical protein
LHPSLIHQKHTSIEGHLRGFFEKKVHGERNYCENIAHYKNKCDNKMCSLRKKIKHT